VLTLSRRRGESIAIGPDVVVTVVRAARGQVQLSIAAPRDVPILRGELLRRGRAPEAPPPEERRD
jgi:carbon storage regulator